MILIVTAIAVLLIIVLLARRARMRAHRRAGSDVPEPALDGSGRFHALSIRSAHHACAAARALHGKRFLKGAAPQLPLAGCDAGRCECRFVHHPDRRSGDDRRNPYQRGFGGSATRIDSDRRSGPDRRAASGQDPER